MENIEIAERFHELADLLEIKGANPFRVRAYRNAVRTIRGLTRPVAEMVAHGEDLRELPGIGADLSKHIRELIDTGSLGLLEDVAAEIPRELATLTRLEGVGPAKARKLWEELGVTTLDELESAALAGQVEELEGFGPKTSERILRSIFDHRARQGRFLRSDAAAYLRPLLEHLSESPGLVRLEVAGSYRRGLETVGDIDLLAAVDDDSGSVMKRFTDAREVERVERSGPTRGTVLLRSGLSVDLRVLPQDTFGAGLHYFTGSKEHNVEIRRRALGMGLRVSEYGVFRLPQSQQSTGSEEKSKSADGDGGKESEEPHLEESARIAGATEEEVFEAVRLPWIPPPLREGRGEIEAAQQNRLPRLVEADDLRGDLHMHSTWSDGAVSIEEMALACRDRGYEYLAITDHSQAVTVAGGLTPERVREQKLEIEEVRGRVDGIRLLHGCEVDILKDGSLDLPDDVLAELDLVLVAVHSHQGLDGATQTNRILQALAHPMVDILVHPTGRLIGRREAYPVDVEAVLEAAREFDVAVELNSNPRRLDLHDRHLFRARELGIPVSLATDAHRPSHLDHVTTGILQAQRGWLEPANVLNCLGTDELMAWLGRRRS